MTIKMKNRASILNKILEKRNADFYVKHTTTWKNNEALEGYVLISENNSAAPVIYREKWYEQPDYAVVDFLIEEQKKYAFSTDPSIVINKEYILKNVFPELVSNENIAELTSNDICHVKFLDMNAIFRIDATPLMPKHLNENASIKITNQILNGLDLSLDEINNMALENIKDDVYIEDMNAILATIAAEKTGIDIEDFSIDENPPMWVCSNESRHFGAAIMLCPSTLVKIQERLNSKKIIILPSSIHELIAIPFTDDVDLETFQDMVQKVNGSVVNTQERLTDSIYIIEDGNITIGIN